MIKSAETPSVNERYQSLGGYVAKAVPHEYRRPEIEPPPGRFMVEPDPVDTMVGQLALPSESRKPKKTGVVVRTGTDVDDFVMVGTRVMWVTSFQEEIEVGGRTYYLMSMDDIGGRFPGRVEVSDG